MNLFEKLFFLPKKEKSLPETKKQEKTTEERKPPIPSFEEKFLASAETKEDWKTLEGLATPHFIEIQEGGAGIFKTEYYKRERAAYIVDRFLGFNLVPTTIIRTIKGKTGSFQQFIADASAGWEIDFTEIPAEELKKLEIFDFLIGNKDRAFSNFLVKGDKVFAIDHHLAFSAGTSYSFSVIEIFGKKISREIREKIIQFYEWKSGKYFLNDFLEGLLEKQEKDAFFKRLDILFKCAKRGYFLTEKENNKLKF